MKIFKFKHSRTVYGIVSMVLGLVFFVVPMLPFGYVFLFIGSLLLVHKVPAFKKLMSWLKTKDKKGRLEKVEMKVDAFFGTAQNKNGSTSDTR